VLVAVHADKRPAGTLSERASRLRVELPQEWDNVSFTAWAGLTAAFCRQHGASVIIRGVRNRSDLSHEHQLAAMNESAGITTLLLPAKPSLAATSSPPGQVGQPLPLHGGQLVNVQQDLQVSRGDGRPASLDPRHLRRRPAQSLRHHPRRQHPR
jgi:pantetheine-phosphate adenylyltransferase